MYHWAEGTLPRYAWAVVSEHWTSPACFANSAPSWIVSGIFDRRGLGLSSLRIALRVTMDFALRNFSDLVCRSLLSSKLLEGRWILHNLMQSYGKHFFRRSVPFFPIHHLARQRWLLLLAVSPWEYQGTYSIMSAPCRMGSHPSGMSHIVGSSGTSLKDWISTNPQRALGERVLQRFGNDLPFLFKVRLTPTRLGVEC